jgi:hypothetical protein
VLIATGTYHFKPKRLAFRNDYCLRCNAFRRSFQNRTFDFFHIFWIPILPLGFRKRWHCTVCGYQPHLNVKTRRPFKWMGLVILVAVALMAWFAPVDHDMAVFSWVCRIGGPIGAVLLLWYLLRMPENASLKSRLALVSPANDTVCPFCGAQLLVVSSQCLCPSCGVVRL